MVKSKIVAKIAFIVDDVTGLQQRHHLKNTPRLVEKIKGFLLKAKSFRNTATYQNTLGKGDFPYYRSLWNGEKRFVKLFTFKTTVLENTFSIKAELSCVSKTCRLLTTELRLNVSVNEKEAIPLLARKTSEFTQQHGRKKRTAKCLYVTNVTGLLLTCFCGDLHLS